MTRALLAALAGLVLSSCQGCRHPLPPPVPPAAYDAAAPVDGAPDATCAGLCERGRALSCAWAAPTPQGHPCEDVCANATSGGPISWDLLCRARALAQRGCFAVDACP